MPITKNLTFYYSELGDNIQTDVGAPTSTVIDKGATVDFSGWGANLENGHDLVIDAGATLNLAGESVCLSPASTITNSGQFLISGGGNPSVDSGGCGGSGGAFTNTATGTVSDSASDASLAVATDNEGSVDVTAGGLTVDGDSGQTETGSWQAASGTGLAFASGLSTVTGSFSGSGTVDVDCGTNLDLSGQSVKNLSIAGQTTGDFSVTGVLSLDGESYCSAPSIDVPSGTVSIAGDFTPQQYENANVDLTVTGASGNQLDVGQLDVSGTASLSDSTASTSLSVSTAAGVTPAVGQSAQIVTAGTTVGDFVLGATCAGPGVAYQVAGDATGVLLETVADGSC